MSTYFLPGIGGQIDSKTGEDGKLSPEQVSPLLNSYSPRLFGAPPQLSSLNDMRLLSAKVDVVTVKKNGEKIYKTTPGPVGDFYLQNILKDAQVANFVVGRAIFTGGMNNFVNVLRMMYQYGKALSNYSILGPSGVVNNDQSTTRMVAENLQKEANQLSNGGEDKDGFKYDAINQYYETLNAMDDNTANTTAVGIDVGMGSTKEKVDSVFGATGSLAAIATPLLHSLTVQQPFYTFESDWFSYINDVKMMINTAVIMLGLQKSCVRIGNYYVPIGVNPKTARDKDVWSNYRFITPSKSIGDITGVDKQTGDTNQYVSFMIDPTGVSESYTNTVGESQIFSSVIKQGESLGSEIAFITNSSVSKVDDAVMNIADGAISAAQGLVSTLGGGAGRFTAAIAGSMSKSFLGDHTIYPQIFQSHQSTQSVNLRTRFKATDGSAYSYLTELLVPTFEILGMVLPRMSKNNASAYTFPPVVQCHIPGMWGTRLAMITAVNITKNPSGTDASIHGWPTAIDVDITVTDLQHVLVTSPMNRISTFLNNHTMFDYIAQCAGVDKYRVNASMRLITRLALAQSAIADIPHNIGSAILNDVTTWANRLSGTYRI